MLYNIINTVIYLVAAVLLYGYSYLMRCYADITVYELFYYKKMPLKGANPGPFIKEIPALCATLFISGLVSFTLTKAFHASIFISLTGIMLIFLALFLFIHHFSFISFLRLSSQYGSIYEENYVAPSDEILTFPDKKRNLIYIYLESIETCYSKYENGQTEYMKELTELSLNGCDFSEKNKINGACVTPGATFTTGAMVAHTSGIPVNLCIPGTKKMDDPFLPSLIMLGDILKKAGYTQEFILGSDIIFGGRSPLLKSHGTDMIFDYKEAKKTGCIPDDYYVFWGLEDEKLFTNAKNEILRLASKPEPFAATILTVDTHFLDGYKCRLCENHFKEQYANAIACSSRQVASFINWLKEQPFCGNTTIVLAGDHPTMDSGFIRRSKLKNNARKSYVAYLNLPEGLSEIPHEYTTLDLFPTTIAALGVKIKDERLGLGVNLFSDRKTLLEKLGIKKLNEELTKKSRYYNNFIQKT